MSFKILMVDDEPLVLAGYRRLLKNYFPIHTATSGYQGLRLLKNSGPYALVVVDYAMPVMNGVDFTVEARRLYPETVRIMLTGKGDLNVATNALNRGNIFYYLTKPCSKEKMLESAIAAVEYYRHPGSISSLIEPERLPGLIFLYQGLYAWDNKNHKQAALLLNKAKTVFKNAGFEADLARVNVYLAGVHIQNNFHEVVSNNKKPDPGEILHKALSYYQAKGWPPLVPQEKEYYTPALNWAFHNNIETEYLTTLLQDINSIKPDQMKLQARTMGSLQFLCQGKIINETAWRNPKIKLLFLYLLTYRHKKIKRELILDTFWPEMEPRAAANNFSSSLYLLRKVVGPNLISYKKELCWLEYNNFWCDADEFEKSVKTGRKHLRENNLKEALEHYNQAISIYNGDYLEEFLYEDWIAEERKRLQDLFIEALTSSATVLAAQDRYAEAAEMLEKAPLTELCEEEFLFTLINYYIMAGQKTRAKKRLNHYRNQCIKEYGIMPEPDNAQLLE